MPKTPKTKKNKSSEWRPGAAISALSFSRSVEPSLGRMYSAKSSDAKPEDMRPICVVVEGGLGQISPYEKNPDKLESLGKNMPYVHQIARTPSDHSWLVISFRVRFIGMSAYPSMTDTPEVTDVFQDIFKASQSRGVYKTLAARYVWSILSGRFAHRNRTLTSNQFVTLRIDEDEITVDPLCLHLEHPLSSAEEIASAIGEDKMNVLTKFINNVEAAFTSHDSAVSATVTWTGEVGEDASVYPSQAFPTKKMLSDLTGIYCDGESKFGKVLVNEPKYVGKSNDGKPIYDLHALMTDQKIGAALRHFDDWHGGSPVPVNPYAGDKTSSHINRPAKSGRSLYDLLLDEKFMTRPEDADIKDLLFVTACLIRGGVYQTKEGETTTSSENAEE